MLSERSRELFSLMLNLGYPEDFSRLICHELNTDFTATRMIGYLSHYSQLPAKEVADEMLAILADRDRWIDKKLSESAQQTINEVILNGLGDED